MLFAFVEDDMLIDPSEKADGENMMKLDFTRVYCVMGRLTGKLGCELRLKILPFRCFTRIEMKSNTHTVIKCSLKKVLKVVSSVYGDFT
jgi:hypothetical protein